MSAFRPTDLEVVVALVAILFLPLIGGYALVRKTSAAWVPKFGWVIFVLGVVGIESLFAGEPAGVRMLALTAFALSTLKLIAVATERANGMPPLSFPAWLGFSVAWLGMQPRLFASYGGPPLDGAGVLLGRGATNLAVGVALVGVARAVWSATESRFAATLPMLVGLSLSLHFGLGTFLAGVWRLRGVSADAVFREPLRSESLAEFWSRRWNLGFSEMTATLIYRPLSARFGRNAALLAGFVWSGLLHEMAISVPVRAGFGLPMLYFLLHGGLVWVERSLSRGTPALRLAGARVEHFLDLGAPAASISSAFPFRGHLAADRDPGGGQSLKVGTETFVIHDLSHRRHRSAEASGFPQIPSTPTCPARRFDRRFGRCADTSRGRPLARAPEQSCQEEALRSRIRCVPRVGRSNVRPPTCCPPRCA
jgi:hypothetical protein